MSDHQRTSGRLYVGNGTDSPARIEWPPATWQPIDTVPEGIHVLLFWPKGERGSGGMETATLFWERLHDGSRRVNLWSHGGPNSGLDWDPRDYELPTHWMRLPLRPDGEPWIPGT